MCTCMNVLRGGGGVQLISAVFEHSVLRIWEICARENVVFYTYCNLWTNSCCTCDLTCTYTYIPLIVHPGVMPLSHIIFLLFISSDRKDAICICMSIM